MKLILAIISSDDTTIVMNELIQKKYQVTKLSSSGGFLRKKNTTIMVGCGDEQVHNVIQIIQDNAQQREEIIPVPSSEMSQLWMLPPQIIVGGATIFVLNIDQFYKI